MDADFEQHYQAAERAYGLGKYAEAHALTSALWDQLQSPSNEHDPGLILGCRAVVSLLLGHIQLHGSPASGRGRERLSTGLGL